MESNQLERAAAGCLIGMAVGDALGLPCEGLSPRRQRRLFPELRHQFFFGRGLVSDDTEHAVMTAQAILVSGGEPAHFTRDLAWRLRWWLTGLPAGVGLATLRSVLRLWFGIPPRRSGVHSAGNGPCMRAPILGTLFHHDPEHLRVLVAASTRMTHTHPEALAGAWLVALAAAESTRAGAFIDPEAIAARLVATLDGEPSALGPLVMRAAASAAAGEDTSAFAASLGLEGGVSGYVLHTVPVALHAWWRHPGDYESAVRVAIRCGGDADTVAAITGGIVGAGLGPEGIPPSWLAGLAEWPCGVAWLTALGQRSARAVRLQTPEQALHFSIPALVLRNVLFLLVVLFHGFRRLAPPY